MSADTMRVWKFELLPFHTTLQMPQGAQILSVGTQGPRLYVWALCDVLAPFEVRSIIVTGTDHDVPPVGRFIGTAQMEDGGTILVWHLWEAP